MAKAQAGKTYAQVVNGRCHKVYPPGTFLEWNENDIFMVDVTGNVPQEGYDYTGVEFIPHVKTPQEIAAEAAALVRQKILLEKNTVLADPDIISFKNKTANDVANDAKAATSIAALRQEVAKLSQLVNILTKLYLN